MIPPEAVDILQLGIAGVALWMMYSITYNQLHSIQETLNEILVELKKIGDIGG